MNVEPLYHYGWRVATKMQRYIILGIKPENLGRNSVPKT
jgi:hypothetical protein